MEETNREAQVYHFAFGVDAKYVKYAGVLMTSILMNNIGKRLAFHFLCDGLDNEDKEKLALFTTLYNNTAIYIYDVHEHIENLKKSFGTEQLAISRLNYTVFIRLMVPMLIDPSIDRVMYLDADMLCVNDVTELYNMDLGECPLAAVLEGDNDLKAAVLGIETNNYFNAGCMLINVPKWKEMDLTYKVFDTYRKNFRRYRMIEQDTLNDILRGNFKVVDRSVILLMEAFNPIMIRINKEKNVFWHFVNVGKPWFKYADAQVAEPYWEMVGLSLWRGMEKQASDDLVTCYLAGKNARVQGQYEDSSYYLELAADTLMDFYMKTTKQGKYAKKIPD